MKISIIIPVYNSAQTLRECLGAIFNSDVKNFEVIVVSDNSPDNSVEITKEYPCEVVELSKNDGPANARNQGAKVATGDILFFVDYGLLPCIIRMGDATASAYFFVSTH